MTSESTQFSESNTCAARYCRLRKAGFVFVQALLTLIALLMCGWATIPWLAPVGFAYLGLSAISAELSPERAKGKVLVWTVALAWVWTLALPLSCWLIPDDRPMTKRFLDYHYAVLTWVVVAMSFPLIHRAVNPLLKGLIKTVMMVGALAGAALWVGMAYLENRWLGFHLGLLLALVMLVLLKSCFSLPAPAILTANTLILITVCLPLTGFFFPPDREFKGDPQELKKYYCYRMAKQNWKAYEQWCNYFGNDYGEVSNRLIEKNPYTLLPLRLRKTSQAKFIDCDISINSKGFRGREISEDKGDAYRIVAIGESTTFGFTIDRDGKPWPELFEQIVRERLKPNRPVEVINAGVPGIMLPENLNRFPDEILPLKPDMIICYHGINGFPLLDDAVPPLRGAPPPEFKKRPLQMLANSEYNLKLFLYRQTQSSKLYLNPPTFSNLLETKYAAAYEKLIAIARTNNIRLVIANFPLAVNAQSPPELVDFFRKRFSGAYWYIRGNIAHDHLVRQIAQRNPDVAFVDTQPHIDGEDEKYLDLMHLTMEGDQQLAENFFSGLKSILESELTGPREATDLSAQE